MIDLSKQSLPDTVSVCGRDYTVQTDFRFWLRFAELTSGKKAPAAELMFLYPCEKPPASMGAVTALFDFYNPQQELPRVTGGETGGRALDYVLDSDLIFAAFWQQYGIDLTEAKLHWWKFQALMRGLQDTKLNEIISYRLYRNTTGKSDQYTREMERLRSAWELPDGTDGEADEKALDDFNALFE